MKNKKLRALTEGAVMLAVGLVLNSVPIFRLPNGGSIDLGMIPIFLFALRWGLGWGLLEGFLFGLIQIFIEGAVAWGWQSLLLDFLVAFTPLGVAGLFRGKGKGIFVGILLGCILRFLVHYISGVTIYAIIAPTELFGVTWMNPWTYSLAYNGSYMLIDTILCILVFAALYKPLNKYIQAEDLKVHKPEELKEL
ncbi:MAG: energy-coupled thiamine transporter ThiT [Oscillospiraceae bacterium]|nr:energy-coupled thiamine transporter ThiT [Oscillospiraceae bacterium]